jgi:hypothetical protein
MIRPLRQQGVTLVVSLIMLVVLTVLVVSVIRFTNIHLKISGNMQVETEAQAAAQVALESTVDAINAAPNISAIAAQPNLTVSTGGISYAVSVAKPACVFTKNIPTSELDPTKAGDQKCFESGDQGEKLVTSNNTLTQPPTACKDQQWDVVASVDDKDSGAKTSLLQGVSVRVGAEVVCP